MDTVRRTAQYPCRSPTLRKNAPGWRFNDSEIDKMEVSTPSAFLKPAYFPDRMEFSAADFRFFCWKAVVKAEILEVSTS
jgi:hypothetical protein